MTPPVPGKALWSEFARGRDPELWEQLAPEFERLAHSVAALFARSRCEHETLFQVALVALVKALDRYQPGAGRTFADFATPLVISDIRAHQRRDRIALALRRRLAVSRGQEAIH